MSSPNYMNFYLKVNENVESEEELTFWQKVLLASVNGSNGLEDNGLYFSQMICWNKLHPVMNRKDFLSCYELCFYCWKEEAAHQFFGPANERDLWEVKKESNSETVHITQKPVELSVKAITLSSQPGENVLELFGGSGSTLIGCEQTGRNCCTMEIDQAYCDIIVKRWKNFMGKTARRIPSVK